MADEPEQLVMRGTARYSMTVGYGHVYDFHIEEVIRGDFTEPRVRLTVLAGETDRLTFLANHRQPARLEGRFARGGPNQPYRTMPINGFVDAEMTAWEIQELRSVPS
jgi:hypothetical protein